METDLSLIEIDGEDDSLLHQIINGDSKNPPDLDLNSTIGFACSPLQTINSNRSTTRTRVPPMETLKEDEDWAPEDITNKENLNKNSSTVSSFAEKPQQIKKRKKGGGFNLRKSLAWNRAFFTEEGVLDPLELSLLSGSSSKSCIESPFSVQGKGRRTPSKSSSIMGDRLDLRELSAKSILEDRKVGGSGLLPNNKSIAQDEATPVRTTSLKMHLGKGINRSVSKGGGCPRRSGPSSENHIPNTKATKATMKDSKLPKLRASKPDSTSLPMISKNAMLCTKRSNSNPNAPSEKNVRLKLSSNNIKNASACASSSAKSSGYHSRKNMAKSPLITHLSANSEPLRVSRSTVSGSRVTSDPILLAAEIHAPIGHASSKKVAVSLPQNAICVAETIPCAQFQPSKPSGLRMPSPSLGYFGQAKASASQSVQFQRNAQPCNLPTSTSLNTGRLSNVNYIGEIKLLDAPTGRQPGTNKTSSMTLKCSIPSAVTPTSHKTLESNMELKKLKNVKKVETEIPSDPKSSDTSIYGQQSRYVHDVVSEQFGKKANTRKTDPDQQISHNKNEKLEMNDDILLVLSGSSEQTQKDKYPVKVIEVSPRSRFSAGSELERSHIHFQLNSAMQVKVNLGAHDRMGQPHIEAENRDFVSDKQFGNANNNSDRSTSMVHKDCLRVDHDANEQFGKQAELRNTGLDKIEQISNGDNPKLQTNNNIFLKQSRSSEVAQIDDDLRNFVDVSKKIQDSTGAEFEKSRIPSHLSFVMKVEDGVAGVDNMIKKPNAENAHLDSLYSNSSVENHDFIPGTQFRDGSDDHNSSASMVHSNCLEVLVGVDQQSGQQTKLEKSCPDEDGRISLKEDYRKQAELIDTCLDKVEQISHGENLKLQMIDNIFLKQSRSSEVVQIDDDLANFVDFSKKIQDSTGAEFEKFRIPSQPISVMKVEDGAAGIDNMMKKPNAENAHLDSLYSNSSVENHNFIPGQFRDGTDDHNSDTSMMHSNCLEVPVGVDEQSGEQTELEKSYPVEDGQIFLKENYGLQMTDETFLTPMKSSEESLKDNGPSNVIEVCSEFIGSCESESESSLVPSHITPAVEVKEGVAGVDSLIKHSHVEDAIESLNLNSLVESNELISETPFAYGIDNSNQVTSSIGPESSLRLSKDQTAGAVTTCVLGVCSSTEEIGLAVQTMFNGSIPLVGFDGLIKNIEANLTQDSKVSDGQYGLENSVIPAKVNGATMPVKENYVDDTKQEALTMKYQLDAIPFSDEWLAALESAGEKILTMKSGPVQNSPPDKSLPEPGPWSPVKRKSNQEIGPFDCTKHTNLPPPDAW